jgi:hypothetical protein
MVGGQGQGLTLPLPQMLHRRRRVGTSPTRVNKRNRVSPLCSLWVGRSQDLPMAQRVQDAGGSEGEAVIASIRVQNLPAWDTCAARNAGVMEPVFSNICVQKRIHRFNVTDQVESRCTMDAYAVRPGTQYLQDPHVWGDPLTPGGAKYSQNHIRHQKRARESLLQNDFSTGSLGA